MPTYLFTYKGATQPDNPEEGQQLMNRWREWVNTISDRIVIANSPVGPAKAVSSDGITEVVESTVTNGFTALSAASLEEAVSIAQSCPHTEIGVIEVREMFEMPNR
ncbi:MAG: YciI family protein [Pseudomonadota bacterium]